METSIVYFCQCFYIHAIKNLALNFTHTQIIGTYHCGNTRSEALERCAFYQDVFYRLDYV